VADPPPIEAIGAGVVSASLGQYERAIDHGWRKRRRIFCRRLEPPVLAFALKVPRFARHDKATVIPSEAKDLLRRDITA